MVSYAIVRASVAGLNESLNPAPSMVLVGRMTMSLVHHPFYLDREAAMLRS